MIDVSQTPGTGDGPNQRLRELERQLKEKEALLQSREQTVKELTERLAHTVERLDRVHRVGTDRITVNSAGFPKEVIQQQTELVEELQKAVDLWENMQLGVGLGNLELQLSDLKELIEEHFREPEPEPEPVPEPEASQAETVATGLGDTVTSEGAAGQAILNQDAPETDSQATEDEEPDFATNEICPLRPPEIVNLTEASLLDLKRSVQQQDKYIDYLSARLQRAAEKSKSVDWEELARQPEALKKKLEHTATKLQQSRHFAEFEVALQFTRLRRKERELKLISDELVAEMKSVGKLPDAEAKDSPGGRRWMRMLGMGKPESE